MAGIMRQTRSALLSDPVCRPRACPSVSSLYPRDHPSGSSASRFLCANSTSSPRLDRRCGDWSVDDHPNLAKRGRTGDCPGVSAVSRGNCRRSGTQLSRSWCTAPMPAWGSMVRSGYGYLPVTPRPSLFRGFAIFATVLGVNLLGDGVQTALDPQSPRDGSAQLHVVLGPPPERGSVQIPKWRGAI